MKIKRITKTPFEGRVHDIGCKPDHVFFANGLLVHNCYKDNSSQKEAVNMSFEDFKIILDKFPHVKVEIAEIECENKIIEKFSNEEVMLKNGQRKKVSELIVGDEIDA